MLRPEVCAIEWDGAQFLGVTIDIYCFVFVVENFATFELTLYRELQCWQGKWCRSDSLCFEPRSDLAKAAKDEATECWHLFTMAHGHSPEFVPALRLYLDPAQIQLYLPFDLNKLVTDVAAARDMNTHLKRRPE